MTEKRFNCHVKFSAMPNGIMVLDYEKHGDEQTVIEDISREKAHRVMDRLNELNDENEQLKSELSEQGTQLDFLKDENKHMRDLVNENEQLKQALKNSYINEICENCKYGHYYLSDNFDGGFEGDFECLKKHFGNEHWKCDGLTECDDFELDFKGDVE